MRLPLATALALVLAWPLAAGAQTSPRPAEEIDPNAATEGTRQMSAQTPEDTTERGAADPESVLITLGSQATEIREILMAAGEVDAEAVKATERAREIATQAIDATGIILPETPDTQVTTTRRSDVEVARESFARIEAALSERLEALLDGDAATANRARLAAIQTINDLPESVRFDGEVAEGDSPTSEPGGAQPILQQ